MPVCPDNSGILSARFRNLVRELQELCPDNSRTLSGCPKNHQLKKEKQRLKILQNQRKDLERKERTHRLCQHGVLLERYFPPDEFTDEMIRFLMDGTFNRQDEAVRDLMEEVKDIFQSEEKDKTIAD